ncbi:MAG: DoxX family protein [Bacteroidales bacterium]
MSIIRNISRIIAGLVFMFSGFVKGIDPLGFTYKLIDYFEAFHLDWLDPTALYLSIFVSALEFVIGFALVINARPRLAIWGNLLFMAVFTPLTLYLALENPVSDCGCFGDAIVMTNWETFFKNIVLLAFALILFLTRKQFNPYWSQPQQNGIIALGFLIMFAFSYYSYQHLPIIDFRAWKVGSDMTQEIPPPTVYIVYENNESGEQKEWRTEEIPYNEPGFNNKWTFVEQRVIEADAPDNTLRIENKEGENVSEDIINLPTYNFLLVAYDIQKADKEAMIEMEEFYRQASRDSLGFAVLTGSLFNEINAYKQANNLHYSFYIADDIALKTVIRANPGLLLLKEGKIIEKWHHNDFPQYAEFKNEYLK